MEMQTWIINRVVQLRCSRLELSRDVECIVVKNIFDHSRSFALDCYQYLYRAESSKPKDSDLLPPTKLFPKNFTLFDNVEIRIPKLLPFLFQIPLFFMVVWDLLVCFGFMFRERFFPF